tara:strand:+ start:125 stop:541 length:417 start_codon:yes stop_codon:yes gene_type:complete
MSNKELWSKYTEGLHIEWPFSFSKKDLQLFSDLSNDFNPIHLETDFAKSKGFKAPLVHGLLLSSQMSRLIGQELPDNNAILTSIKMDFILPCFPEDKLIFEADLTNKSEATYSLEFKCNIEMNGETLCRGMVSAIWRP